tara:strand:- start:750 stop:926 length:177 start_codon:yes stop_codon:yes gene_type:complete
MRNVKEQMMQVTAGEFSSWYDSLSNREKSCYHSEFIDLQRQFKNSKIKRERNGLRQNI